MNAPHKFPATGFHWCPSCETVPETYVMSIPDMEDRGARFAITDALTGISWFRLHGALIPADVPLCSGCDAPLVAAPAMEFAA